MGCLIFAFASAAMIGGYLGGIARFWIGVVVGTAVGAILPTLWAAGIYQRFWTEGPFVDSGSEGTFAILGTWDIASTWGMFMLLCLASASLGSLQTTTLRSVLMGTPARGGT